MVFFLKVYISCMIFIKKSHIELLVYQKAQKNTLISLNVHIFIQFTSHKMDSLYLLFTHKLEIQDLHKIK